jgi:hypothetical protein
MQHLRQFTNPAQWRGRAFILACVILLPFLGFLVGNHYPLLRVEAAAGLFVLAAGCALLGFLFRGRSFQGLIVVVLCVISAGPLQREVSRFFVLPVAAVAGAIVVGVIALMVRTQERFYTMLVTFALAMLGTHAVRAAAFHPTPYAVSTSKPGHVLHLILDEHMGPGGLPQDIAECRRASQAIRKTFQRAGFELFPNAFSNYPTTFDSIPSLLNRELLSRRREFLRAPAPDLRGIYHVNAEKFLSEYRKRGYAVRVLQYSGIDFADGNDKEATEYAETLAPVARIPGAWTDRFRLLVGHYQASDRLLAAFKGFFPFRFGLRMIFPLSAEAVWPGLLADIIASASGPTVFLAHILSPHSPYVYHRDGSMREIPEWLNDEDYERLDRRTYEERYSRYAEQLEHVESQIEWLLSRLEEKGLLDAMTIVVHGDHGSRILMRRTGLASIGAHGAAGIDRYDYGATPDPQDLLDRFSILLAIKRPGRHESTVNETSGPAFRFLSECLHGEEITKYSAANSVFLFDQQGNPKEIRILDIWNR